MDTPNFEREEFVRAANYFLKEKYTDRPLQLKGISITVDSVELASNALLPMSRIDFSALPFQPYQVYDLEEIFYRGLAESYISRILDGSTVTKITKSDVRNAMIAIGVAIRSKSDLHRKFSTTVLSICPYCAE